MAKVYTFNRPIVALVLVPLLFLTIMLLYGVVQEFNVIVIVLTLVSLLFLLPILFLAFLRRLRIEDSQVVWITPKTRKEIAWEEVQNYGIIKYRSFRFMFVCRLETPPFADPSKPVVSDDDTFIVQFRRGGWNRIKAKVQSQHPGLKPSNLVRK